jgi:hypothetical protein
LVENSTGQQINRFRNSFTRKRSGSAIGAETFMNNAGLGYLRGRELYDGFRHGAIKLSSFVPIMG